MNRYEILTALHDMIKPRGYLEIGVQTGASLTLSKGCKYAVGVDPDMGHLTYDVEHALLVETTSDDFFSRGPEFKVPLDLVFIDGLHHADQVWRDLLNASLLGHEKTVYVLDDVLPRNQGEASRVQCPGDWTGDVWRVCELLPGMWDRRRGDLILALVDTFPTGVMIIGGPLIPAGLYTSYCGADFFESVLAEVPETILTRDPSLVAQPAEALEEVAAWLTR